MRRPIASLRAVPALAFVALLFVVSLGAVGCERRTEGPKLAPAAESVQELLELRSRNSTDTAAYLRHVESTALAEALATDSASRKATERPVPAWETPAVSKQSSSTAEVEVVWRPTEQFEGWPEATRFIMRRIDGSWLVVDAVDTSATAR